tara:strand:- start:208 stop:321 length:114 start_codon:yes stop_codon:yes gene_type:complete
MNKERSIGITVSNVNMKKRLKLKKDWNKDKLEKISRR